MKILKIKIFGGPRIQTAEGINVTKYTASLEPSYVSFQSNKDPKIGGDHFNVYAHPAQIQLSFQ